MNRRRKLLVLRHASADYHHQGTDLERPLSAHGHHEAEQLGELIERQLFRPGLLNTDELIVRCSPALRTRQTINLLCSHSSLDELVLMNTSRITFPETIYEATTGQLLELVSGSEADLILVGHNPGLSSLVSWLCLTRIGLSPADCLLLSINDSSGETLQSGSCNIEMVIE